MKYLKIKNINFSVDDSDFSFLSHFSWSLSRPRNEYYYPITRVAGKHKSLSKIIMSCPDGLTVDHIDGNELNNCRSNLRICTKAQNLMNKPMYKSNKCGYKGVFIVKDKYICARIYLKGKQYRKGGFSNLEAAASWYNDMAVKLHGEFARLNKI